MVFFNIPPLDLEEVEFALHEHQSISSPNRDPACGHTQSLCIEDSSQLLIRNELAFGYTHRSLIRLDPF